MREFETGATRNSDEDKLDYEGFYHPKVMDSYARYMHKHRKQADGKLRDSDNWQKGMPFSVYMKSMFRHFMEVWRLYRRGDIVDDMMEDALCALLFNVQGMLFEVLRPKSIALSGTACPDPTGYIEDEGYNPPLGVGAMVATPQSISPTVLRRSEDAVE